MVIRNAILIITIVIMIGYSIVIIVKRLANKRTPIKYSDNGVSVEFFNDIKSPYPDKRKVGSLFWIACRKKRLTLHKVNWGSDIDYKLRDDGFIETIHSVSEDEMPKLMKLCNNAKNDKTVIRYIYNKFSLDGYASYGNMLEWLEKNGIEYSTYWNV